MKLSQKLYLHIYLNMTKFLKVVVCFLLSSTTVLGDNPCLIPTERTDGDWPKHHEDHLNIVAEDVDDQIVWIGDSIINFMQNSTLWKSKISSLGSVNLGVGGDLVENVLWRMENGEFDFKIPIKAVVIFVGTNNVGHNTTTEENIAEGIINLVDVSKKFFGEEVFIIIPTLLPRGEYPNEQRDSLTKINRLLVQKYPINPTDNTFVVQIGQTAIQPDGTLSVEDFYDFVHPTDQGYDKFFTAVYDLLVSILN